MTSQNEQAEELMRKIEKEEERTTLETPDKRIYHLCIVNLVIGTLYCAKGNYEFGISRVMKSLEPFDKKLGTDTWFYAKRCFVSLFEALAKQLIIIKDGVYQEILEFFDHCENFGREIPARVDLLPVNPEVEDDNKDKNTVSYEARLLKSLFLRLYDGC
jgi:tetratricopeptide repeat protein 30